MNDGRASEDEAPRGPLPRTGSAGRGGRQSGVWGELAAAVGRYLRRRVRDEHAAEDLAQEVMVKVQANLHAAPVEAKLAGWVFQIARNTLTDYYRSRRNHAAPAPMKDPAVPAAEPNVTAELAACLRPMIQRLPPPYREALELSELEGLTQQDLANRAGVSLSGAKSRVQRGREHLKKMLLDCCQIDRDSRGRVVAFERRAAADRYCGDNADDSCG